MERYLQPLKGSLTRGIVKVAAAFAVGAAGAVGEITDEGGAIEDITRDSAGVYIVTLKDFTSFLRLAGATFNILSGGAASDHTFQIEDVDAEARTITFRVLAAAVETDPADGDEVMFVFDLITEKRGPRA